MANSLPNALRSLLSPFLSPSAKYSTKNSADAPSPWGDPIFVLNALPKGTASSLDTLLALLALKWQMQCKLF